MGEKKDVPAIQVALTKEQQAQVRQATGKAVVRLKLEALEERLAPGRPLIRLPVASHRSTAEWA